MAIITKSQSRLFTQLIAEYEPEIRRAFMASVADLQAGVDFDLLLDRLRNNDINGAIAALNISPAVWNQYTVAMNNIYMQAGVATAAQITASDIGGITARFNMQNPRAERWIRENVATRVVGFTEEAVESARIVIEAGYARGENPRTIALDLAGRTTGSGTARTGGIIGLDAPRAARLTKVTEGMRTADGVQSLVTKHADGTLTVNYKVNKATSDRILRAYRNETAVPAAERIISERQYKNALLKARADTIAETETANAVMSARDEEWQQLTESGAVDPANIIKTWRHRRGATASHRPDHLAMSGTEVRGLNTPFVFPDGAALQYAHDPSAPAEHLICCACDVEFRVDHRVGLS